MSKSALTFVEQLGKFFIYQDKTFFHFVGMRNKETEDLMTPNEVLCKSGLLQNCRKYLIDAHGALEE